MVDINVVKETIEDLIGKKLQYINRSCDIIDIGFGDLFIRNNANGLEHTTASYSLHLLCPFRITNTHSVLVGSDDLFQSLSDEAVVDLSVQNSCVFDDKIKRLQPLFSDELVENIKINKFGDLSIYLTTLCICIFNVGSTINESWRFFETAKNSQHLVINGTGYELV